MPPSLSIALPCYNEAAGIVRTLAALRTWFPRDTQILVIDDGSTDGTAHTARRYAESQVDERIHVHARPVNGGKGASIRSAAPLATGDYVVFVDADLAFGRDSIAAVLQGLENSDIAIGNRRHVESRYSVPVRLFGFLYRRHLVGLTFNALVRTAFGLPYRDTQCGLKAFRRGALERLAASLTIDGFAIDVEILLMARAMGLRVIEVPVVVTYESAASSVRLIRSAAAMSTDLLRMMARRASGRYRAAGITTDAAMSPPPGPGPSAAPLDPPRAPSARR
jgi:glycosyltransferase involved in cell wall biosynthesis